MVRYVAVLGYFPSEDGSIVILNETPRSSISGDTASAKYDDSLKAAVSAAFLFPPPFLAAHSFKV